jgi:hypothetical protein
MEKSTNYEAPNYATASSFVIFAGKILFYIALL